MTISHSGISQLQNFIVQNLQKRAITQKISYDFFSILHQIFYIYHPLSADTSFKLLASILSEILHLQNFIPCVSKGHNFTRRDNSKKIKPLLFSHEESINEVPRRYLDAPPPPPPRTHTHTYGQAETNMLPTFSKLGA